MREWTGGQNVRRCAGIVGALGLGGLIACGGATEANARAEFIDEVVSRGFTRAQGQCVVDGAVDRWGDFESEVPDDPGGAAEMMRLFLECAGAASGEMSDCLVESVTPRAAADELSMDDFTDAVDGSDPRELAEAAMQCNGMTPDAARCVADTMAADLGDGVFERGIDSSTERRHALEANLRCQGMTAAQASCVSDAAEAELGEKAFDATGLVSASEQRFVFEATLECVGMTSAAARCASEAIAAEYGEEWFGLGSELTSSEQASVDAMISRCATGQ